MANLTYIHLIAILTTLFSTSCHTKKQSQDSETRLYEIKGNLKFTYDYCGGARPSEEMLAKLKEPRVIEGFTVYLKQGKENSTAAITDSARCDSSGNYFFRVPKGDYVILLPAQIKKYDLNNFNNQFLKVADEACFYQWWKKGLFSLQVTTNMALPDSTIHRKCNGIDYLPCMSYNGPLPPSMMRE